MFVRALYVLAISLLSGCASVDFYQCQNADCAADSTGHNSLHPVEGLRYYPPKPYLLVAEVPITDASFTMESTTNGKPSNAPQTKLTLSLNDKGGNTGATNKPQSDDGSSTTPGSASDTSFGLATKQYQIKLVYLPDYSHPMVLQMHSGLFGSSEVKPQFQDGWMLTGLDATADTKAAETLGSLASLVNGGGSSATGSSKGNKSGNTSASLASVPDATKDPGKAMQAALASLNQSGPVLVPGLYSIDFSSDGKIKGVNAVSFFCSDGIHTRINESSLPAPCP